MTINPVTTAARTYFFGSDTLLSPTLTDLHRPDKVSMQSIAIRGRCVLNMDFPI
jgi:hypothetical protein